MKGSKERLTTRYALAAAAALAGLVLGGGSAAQAAPVAACDMRLQVTLTPDVRDPRDTGFLSSLLGNHPDYRLTLQGQVPENPSVLALDLTGPGSSAYGCREVANSMRKDARVVSVEVRRDTGAAALPLAAAPAVASALPVSAALSRSTQALGTVQSMGTAQAGPDGDWVLKRSSGVSYAQQAQVRYECDIWAAAETGFDPTADDGGVPRDEFTPKRTEYLDAEAACFKAHGYLVR